MTAHSDRGVPTTGLVFLAGLVLAMAWLVFQADPAPAVVGPAAESSTSGAGDARTGDVGGDARTEDSESGTDPGSAEISARQGVAAAGYPPRLRVVVRLVGSGEPVVEQPVSLVGWDVPARLAALTDSAGEAVFEPVPPGRYFEDGGLGLRLVEVRDHGETLVEVEVSRQFTLRGRVTDELGRPVPGAEVWTTGFHLSFEGASRRAVTDAAGRFAWDSHGAGYPCENVFARADGYVPSPVHAVTAELLGDDAEEIILALRPAELAVVSGTVVSATDGEPVAGATVTLRPRTPAPVEGLENRAAFLRYPRSTPRQSTRADQHGAFSFEDVSAGEASFRIRAEGYGVLDTLRTLQPGRSTGLRFELGAPLAIHGRVVDGEGRAVVGAIVSAPSVADQFRAPCATDADGRYRVEPVPGRNIRLSAEAEGYEYAQVEVTIPEDAWDVEQQIELQRSAELLGVLLGESGAPLVGWGVMPAARAIGVFETDSQGHFALPLAEAQELVASSPAPARGMPSGPPRRIVRDAEQRSDGRWVWRALEADAPSATIAGRIVIEPAVDRPRLVLRLHAPVLGLVRSLLLELRPDGDGSSFECGPWPPGDYALELWAAEGEDRIPVFALGTRSIERNQRLDLGTLRIPAAVPLAVSVVRPEDVSPRAVRCDLLRQPGETKVPGGVDLDGRFVTTALAPGDYLLRISGSGFAPVERRFTLRPGEPESIRIELAACRDLKLTLEWRREQPLHGQVRVLIHDHDSGVLRATGAVWATELLRHGANLGLPDGRYRLSLSCGGESVPVFFTPGGDDAARFTVD